MAKRCNLICNIAVATYRTCVCRITIVSTCRFCYYRIVVMAKRCNLICNIAVATYRTCICRITIVNTCRFCYYRTIAMTLCRNFSLSYNYYATYRAVLTFSKTGCCTSRCNRRINCLFVSGSIYININRNTARAIKLLETGFGTGCFLNYLFSTSSVMNDRPIFIFRIYIL